MCSFRKLFTIFILYILQIQVNANTPVKCDRNKSQIPNPDDPYSFYKCNAGGVPTLFRCPPKTRFDAKLEVCNWDHSPGAVTAPNLAQISPTENYQENNEKKTTTPVTCDKSKAQFPNPNDSYSFYKCTADGIPVLYHCPPKTRFDVKLEVCNPDHSQGAGTTTNLAQINPSGNDHGSYGKNLNTPIKCDPNKAQLPNPEDPYSFYKCTAGGVPVLHPCPPGTRFDTKLEVCNWDNVQGTPNMPIESNLNGNRPVSNFNHLIMELGCSNGPKHGPPKLYQNQDDCASYYTCNMGKPILTHCPRGLFFNPQLGACDNIIVTGCKYVNPNKPGGGPIFEEQRQLENEVEEDYCI